MKSGEATPEAKSTFFPRATWASESLVKYHPVRFVAYLSPCYIDFHETRSQFRQR